MQRSLEHHASIESVNGATTPTEDDESIDEPTTNGVSGRTSTLPERSRQGAASAPPITVPSGTGSHRHHSPKTHRDQASSRNVSGASVIGGSGSSPQNGTAKETFLNYFFGQNGPGPLSGTTTERAGVVNGSGFAPTGRDVTGADPVLESGLMAGKRTLENSNAAYDMKSLGRHIEAVSS